jgi:hypothetical protein
MKINDVYRYSRPYSSNPAEIDGLGNYFHITYSHNSKFPLLESGINPIQEIKAPDGKRRPAILISSSPHKIGGESTPWQDFFDSDNGHIRYYGDNKTPGTNPAFVSGNKTLLHAFSIHSSLETEVRSHSVPLLFFKRVPLLGKQKGFVSFQGFGIIERVTLITQYDRKKGVSFTNYAFDFLVLDLMAENEEFDWKWINRRRDSTLSLEESISYAPNSWKIWIREGNKALEKCRRRVSKLSIVKKAEQVPLKNSAEERTLRTIYKFYETRKHRFESLAASVTEKILSDSGGKYKFGWITRIGADNGVDFVGRLDLGTGFSRVKVIVLGQAKCEKTNSPTNGVHLARTVARLRRGWIGVYVTTSFFSEASQREVIEDQYPLLLVHGLRLAKETAELADNSGYKNILEYLTFVDSQFEENLQFRNPEEILID